MASRRRTIWTFLRECFTVRASQWSSKRPGLRKHELCPKQIRGNVHRAMQHAGNLDAAAVADRTIEGQVRPHRKTAQLVGKIISKNCEQGRMCVEVAFPLEHIDKSPRGLAALFA